MRRLIICEKGNAADRISFILSGGQTQRSGRFIKVYNFCHDGKENVCIGLRGHIVELDYTGQLNDWRKTPLKTLASAEPVAKISEKGIVETLRSVSKDVDEVVLATDYDREGEIIGVEALEAIDFDCKNALRARFSALTVPEVKDAFNNLGKVDLNLANSARSRQYIDLAWGAVLTRFLSLNAGMGKNILSAGRVQSPTLTLIVNRFIERRDFVSQPYWDVSATLEHGGEHFNAEHTGNHFKKKEEAKEAVARLKKQSHVKVVEFSKEEKNDYSPPPFDTTSFLREVSKIGLGSKKAMDIAEELYMKGKISYPRTDNMVYPRGTPFRKILANLKKGEFKKLAEKIDSQTTLRPRRGSKTATDHPPIHPVDHANKKELSNDEWKVYELVVRRFLATLAPPAVIEERESLLEAGVDQLRSRGIKVIFPGWMEYYPYIERKESWHPELLVEEMVPIKKRFIKEKHTRPPAPYNHGSLIYEMEKLGLGTKSTRHEIIEKLQKRNYIHRGKMVEPTESGIAVVTALKEGAPVITEPEMTAKLEEEMTEIALGKKTYEEVIIDSRVKLNLVVDELEQHRELITGKLKSALKEQHNVGACPKCKKPLVIRRSKRG
ncbi:MAG TPA: DNA topoisomerase I, partial [Euryarchaeota archaeon]|nr:DNA topoisomerase I [Euryarchaeota archaeon]